MLQYILYKAVIIGDSNVGKTAIVTRLNEDTFVNRFRDSIGIDFVNKILIVGNQTVKLQLWDTAGQERFGMLSKGFYRGAKIVILVYDLSDKRSWKNIVDWYNSAQENFRQYDNNTSLEFLLLGNKSDLNNIKVDEDEVKQWCLKKDNMVNIKCSAKTGKNVTKAFKLIISHVINPEFKKIYNLEKPISADVEN